MAAAAMILAGCSNDENETMDNGPVEIRLTSGLEVQNRATHNLDEKLCMNEIVHVWVDDAEDQKTDVTSKNLYENNLLVVNEGKLSTIDATEIPTGGEAMYFPSTGNGVNIYALHTNATWTGNTFPTSELTHTVFQDQQCSVSKPGEGYQGSDLVYAKLTNVERTKDEVKLTFKHLLSKIEVVLVHGAGNFKISKVEILNTKLNAKFTPSKENDFSVTADGTITDNNPIMIDKGETAKDIAEKTDDTGKVLNEAIIVPQELAAGTDFIRITTEEGGILTYSLPEAKTFEPGKKYRYTITVNLTGLTVTSKIEDWGKVGDPITGTAEMKPMQP